MKKMKIIGICVMLATMLAVIMLCVNSCGNADSPDDTTVSEKTAATGKTEAPSAEITETTGKSSAENIETTGLSQGGNISTGATNTSGGGTIVGHTHQYGPWTTIKEPTCLAMGVQERICTCGTMETRNIDKIEHIIVKDAAKVATCTEPGLTEGSHCSMCGIVIQKQEPILALGHDYVNGRCSRCGEIFEQVSQGLQYTLGSNGTYYIVTGIGACKDSDIVIPAEYKGLPVTSIGDGAFQGCSNLTSIEIPSSVTSIGVRAFWGCSKLKYNEYDNGLYLGNAQNPYLALMETKTIDITSCTIHKQTKVIVCNAFSGCSSLTSIEIPSSVTSIGECAFQDCSRLTSIEIPSSVTSIGVRAFWGCSKLKYNEYDNGLYLGNAQNPYLALMETKTIDITSCTIHKQTKVIVCNAFSGCSSLTSIEIPFSVTSIGEYAFSGCSSLTSIEIPSSVTSIGMCAFSDCSSLTSIEIPSSVTSIGEYVFSDCSSLTSIEIPSSVTSIGDYAFNNCDSLTSIEIPSSVTNIGDYAFSGCSNLTSIEIPSSVTSIGEYAFAWCRNLTSIDIPSSVTSIGDSAFGDCSSLTSIEIPSSVTSIGNGAFYYCSNLTSIEIPSSVTSIGSNAFRVCSSLTGITYKGTKAQWNQIEKGSYWNGATGDYTIHCTDGDIKK